MSSLIAKQSGILIIEDDLASRDALKQALDLCGYSSITATQGREALDLLAGGASPALILLDLMMPVMDGVEFLERHAQDPALAKIPVVVLTAYAERHVQAAALGVAGFLPKPVDFPALLRVVERFCGPARP